MSGTPQYWTGWNAYHDGTHLDDCPWPDESWQAYWWLTGWNDALKASGVRI